MFPLGILKATGSVFKTDFTALPSIDSTAAIHVISFKYAYAYTT